MITVPRARRRNASGPSTEFQSTVVPRYARQTREVDEALLGCYFGGVNSRRIRRALQPLLAEAHLSKSAVSRVVTRVQDQFAVWQQRPLTDERYGVVFLDGFHLRVRLAGRVVVVPVLAALGVTDTGQKQLLRCSSPRPKRRRRGVACSPIFSSADCRRRCSSSPMATRA